MRIPRRIAIFPGCLTRHLLGICSARKRAGAETPALAIGIADLLTIPCLYEHTQIKEKQHAVRGEQSGPIRNQVTPFSRVALLLDKVIEFLTQ